MDDTLREMLRKFISSFIGRIVLAAYTLLIVPVLPSVINFVNDVLGYDLSDAQVQNYAAKAALAIGGLAAVWLLNNGLFERTALKAKALIEAGVNASDGVDVGGPVGTRPPLPPGQQPQERGKKW